MMRIFNKGRHSYIKLMFVGLALLLVSQSATVLAQSADYYRNLQFPFYDPGSSGSSCTGDSVPPGAGAPDGAQFPNLDTNSMSNAIDTWVAKENSRSTLAGLGPTIVASAKNSNISPFLVVAIAAQESSLGNPNDFNVKNANNAFGRTATESQPHFQGGHLWYKWSSVKASVDYTAPENQGAAGGGDMPTYIRNVYAKEIDNGDLLALFLRYAPAGDGNNPQDYSAKVGSWINDLVQLAAGNNTTTAPSTTPSACGEGIFAGDIVKTALGLSWPTGTHGASKGDATTAYQTAMLQYNTATNDYSDCGGFVATVMHASGADDNYVGVYVPSQYDYVKKDSSRYQIIEAVKDTSQLQPGDILMYVNSSNPGDSHTFIYVGQQPGFSGDGASASLGGHVPQAVSAAGSFAYNSRAASGNYFAVRLVK